MGEIKGSPFKFCSAMCDFCVWQRKPFASLELEVFGTVLPQILLFRGVLLEKTVFGVLGMTSLVMFWYCRAVEFSRWMLLIIWKTFFGSMQFFLLNFVWLKDRCAGILMFLVTKLVFEPKRVTPLGNFGTVGQFFWKEIFRKKYHFSFLSWFQLTKFFTQRRSGASQHMTKTNHG